MDLLSQKTEEAGKKLLAERYQESTIDAIDDCLDRADGMAGLIANVAALNNNGVFHTNPKHIEHTARALQMEIKDAIIMLNDFYRVCREQA